MQELAAAFRDDVTQALIPVVDATYRTIAAATTAHGRPLDGGMQTFRSR